MDLMRRLCECLVESGLVQRAWAYAPTDEGWRLIGKAGHFRAGDLPEVRPKQDLDAALSGMDPVPSPGLVGLLTIFLSVPDVGMVHVHVDRGPSSNHTFGKEVVDKVSARRSSTKWTRWSLLPMHALRT
jgi:hypothetical protein